MNFILQVCILFSILKYCVKLSLPFFLTRLPLSCGRFCFAFDCSNLVGSFRTCGRLSWSLQHHTQIVWWKFRGAHERVWMEMSQPNKRHRHRQIHHGLWYVSSYRLLWHQVWNSVGKAKKKSLELKGSKNKVWTQKKKVWNSVCVRRLQKKGERDNQDTCTSHRTPNLIEMVFTSVMQARIWILLGYETFGKIDVLKNLVNFLIWRYYLKFRCPRTPATPPCF